MSCRQHGTYRLWPLMWLWSTDRDQTKDLTGVHRSYLGKYVGMGETKVTGNGR